MRLGPDDSARRMWGPVPAGIAGAVISYVIVVSIIAASWAHECGRFYFDLTFEMSIFASWLFLLIGLFVGLTTAGLARQHRSISRRIWVAAMLCAIIVFGVAYVSAKVIPFTPNRDIASKPHYPGQCATM